MSLGHCFSGSGPGTDGHRAGAGPGPSPAGNLKGTAARPGPAPAGGPARLVTSDSDPGGRLGRPAATTVTVTRDRHSDRPAVTLNVRLGAIGQAGRAASPAPGLGSCDHPSPRQCRHGVTVPGRRVF
jgi:hypothetical protein